MIHSIGMRRSGPKSYIRNQVDFGDDCERIVF
jgi:hypothetical protein